MPVHEIKGAEIVPCRTTFLGSMAAAMCAVDRGECNLAELAGRTGAAFRLNVHGDVCPSGPTAVPAFEYARQAFNQAGRDYEFFFAASNDNLFPMVRKRAIAAIEASITKGIPVIVWGAGVAEFCLVTGFDSDSQRFRISTVAGESLDREGLGYGDLGLGPVPFLEVIVPLEKTQVDEARVAEEALRFAVRHARGGDLRLPGYANGLAAYALWIESLREGRAAAFGMAYNTQVYAEARRFAKAYLADLAANDLFGAAELLGQAAGSYEHVADNLGDLAEMFPFRPDIPQTEKVGAEKAAEAAALLERALFWEADGVGKLEAVLKDTGR